jgi:hypothetical protein
MTEPTIGSVARDAVIEIRKRDQEIEQLKKDLGDTRHNMTLYADERNEERARAERLEAALRGLKYRDEPGEPDRYCDHAAEPCPRCEAARAALPTRGRGDK